MRFTPPRARRHVALLLVVGATVTGCTKVPTNGPLAESNGGGDGPIKVGLVTKTESNPFFVKLRDSARAQAKKQGGELIALSGKFDGDNDGQVAAIENLVQQGVKGILITPSNSGGVIGALKKAQEQGIVVIALDSETDPKDAVSATYATDNTAAGRVLGKYVKASMGKTSPQLVTMDLDPSSAVGKQRRSGFLAGMGLSAKSPAVIGAALTQGDQSKAQQQMENLLQRVGTKVNVVYNINEPAARGAYQALKDKGLTDKVTIGAIDGSCSGVKDVKSGKFAATVMQFPKTMAQQGVSAVIKYAKEGETPKGFVDTGAQLITDKPLPGMSSKDSAWGLKNCWG
ncbi:substrate-binding domain-containing protein [Demetria terragena]|uniref:substrate-binding domain-containing protein n=1 Tax=Demetria terragena TaxID=63959 RepID=UPI00037C8901|nr:substrate-binding domain-containing protein [Demetria terragena]